MTYFKVAKKVEYIWATLQRKFVVQNFIKSPNLVTLVLRQRCKFLNEIIKTWSRDSTLLGPTKSCFSKHDSLVSKLWSSLEEGVDGSYRPKCVNCCVYDTNPKVYVTYVSQPCIVDYLASTEELHGPTKS